jgi:hypothetical protein
VNRNQIRKEQYIIWRKYRELYPVLFSDDARKNATTEYEQAVEQAKLLHQEEELKKTMLDSRVPHPFFRSWLLFFQLLGKGGTRFTIPHARRSTRQVSGPDLSRVKLVVGKVQPSTSRRRQGYFQVMQRSTHAMLQRRKARTSLAQVRKPWVSVSV